MENENQNIYPKNPFNFQKEESRPAALESLLPLLMQMQGGSGMNPEILSKLLGDKASNPLISALLTSRLGKNEGMPETQNIAKESSSKETPFPHAIKVEDYHKKTRL